MSDTLTLRIPGREKETWQKVAQAVGEDLSEFARKAVRLRVQAVQAKQGSPWDDLLGSVRTDAPPATRNYRCSIVTNGLGSGPIYSAVGRISRLFPRCSMICADQPEVRAMTKIGVNIGVGIPQKWYAAAL